MAFISDEAKMGVNVVIGIHTVIEKGVEIGDNCNIGSNVVIKRGTQIGKNVKIEDSAVLGKLPNKSKRSAVTEKVVTKDLKIDNDVIIGANSILYKGAVIGNDCYIADMATVREYVTVDNNTIVGRGVAIENKCSIGKNCKIETNAYITAFSEIGDYCFIAPNVSTANDKYTARTKKRFDKYKGLKAEKGARIGLNATILPGIVLGEDCLVGAGAVVTKDVKSKKVVAGVPAKVVGDVPEEQLLENQ